MSTEDLWRRRVEQGRKEPAAEEELATATEEEVDICYVDYGGYARVPASSLRQIRADFMTLPFQAVECVLANITPLSGQFIAIFLFAQQPTKPNNLLVVIF